MTQKLFDLSRRALITGSAFALAAAAPITPINTNGDKLGDGLDTGDFIEPNFTARFHELPDFARRVVRPEPPRPLTDPAFEWVAGHIHATRSPGVPDYVAPPGRYRLFLGFRRNLPSIPTATRSL